MQLTLFALTLVLAQADPPPPPPSDAATVPGNHDVAQAAREFRRTVYETYRTDREAFDLRWSAGDELWRRWIALKQPAAHREAVWTWFVESRRVAAAGGASELPFLPELPEPTLPTTLENGAAPPVETEIAPAGEPPGLNAPAAEEGELPEFAPAENAKSEPTGAEKPKSKQLQAVIEALLRNSSEKPAAP